MATINDWPEIVAFVATPSIGSISLNTEYVDPHQPNGLPHLKTVAFEYWASATDNVGTATKVAEGLAGSSWEDAALIGGTVRYLWTRPRREARLASGETVLTYGDFYPAVNGAAVTIYSDSDVWTSYTPTVSSAVGTITSASATGRYKRRGRSVIMQATYTLSNAGTGSSDLLISLPFPPATGLVFIGVGYLNPSHSIMSVLATSSGADMLKYDGSSPVSSNTDGTIQIEYEID